MIKPIYSPSQDRYEKIFYRKCGDSGLKLPILSLGMWHNFGNHDSFENATEIATTAFDNGITHFDLANNYGPPYGSAEENFGRILKQNFLPYRDELLISSKAGYDMWPGPYGIGGSRKYIISSCDQSLKRMGLEYVDIFYSHRFDPETPLEETVLALDQLVKSGKALYIGISRYDPDQTEKAVQLFKELKTPFIIHQCRYSLLDRSPEEGVFDKLAEHKKGAIVFSPLAQGMLTNKYLNGIPEKSRMANENKIHLNKEQLTDNVLYKVKALNEMAVSRGQTLAQMSLAWLVRNESVTSVLVGASRKEQLLDSIGCLNNIEFSSEELNKIDQIVL
ncbi:L-glyceraldehyde 3-phosphate reductase [Flammeovirga yaeyamensis]|uniref:L-glyceraldehyde 3-phosphate reductase n=1 Tax=Flammeovirga yaeyamensis TaxID=367791 RepID=A0AAX1N5Z5_9BACT|nr:L-glyceraldehyde 3-phosphate reductase [Flammeovirga yaeyamensis]MBB3698144.1 L-glyceraldehyde 3-phosphate reductase [Flammeovirga yaeyamensis]NMF34499.1 L-glyceraldehyde 3-phosphate reductase [Flammeovirga yaeyamensis]QWG01477.1 L-glyceraldehyde 3-phosphate reductase [Flammeovirga yaeyamensis]